MNCKDVEQQLSALIDGELSPPAEESVFRHVNSCGHCSVYYERLRSVDKLLESEKISEEIDVTDRVMSALSSSGTGASSQGSKSWISIISRSRLVKSAALVLFACLLSLPFIFSPAEESDAVENLVKETGDFLQGISRTFTDAGRGIAAAPGDMALEMQDVWFSMAGRRTGGRITEIVNQTQNVIPQGVTKMSGLFGDLFNSVSDNSNDLKEGSDSNL